MESLTKRKNDFNAVVEGTYHDQWITLNFKITRIEIPENTAVLNDGVYKYRLHGRTDDFEHVQRVNGESGDLEAKINFLGLYEGFVLPYKGGILNILERPRTVCMRDGRVYIDEDMAIDKFYLSAVPSIVKAAGEMFGKEALSELYKQVTIF